VFGAQRHDPTATRSTTIVGAMADR
jgi:hypothetical protein